jgi:multidrug resistance efflux pump
VIGAAQSRQLDAQIALLDDKLARVTLKAPFDGIVVSGDLSQLLGAPVETGKILFQVAPLDDYRVVLQADERDIADLHKGQHGELSLSGLPFQHLVFQVKQITPVATVQDGRNFFRVEAQLDTAPDQIRPGMEGVAKVDVGSRKLIWIWTHSLVDWVRNWAWRDLP